MSCQDSLSILEELTDYLIPDHRHDSADDNIVVRYISANPE